MKLFAAPGFFCIGLQPRNRNLLDGPLISVQPLPDPIAIFCRIAKRPSMWRRDHVSVEGFLVRIVMAIAAADQRRVRCFEINAAMLSVTGNTSDTCGRVGRNDCWHERFRCMTRRTIL